METTLTHQQQWHQRNSDTKKTSMLFIRLDEMEYAEYQYKWVLLYLMWYLPVNQNIRAEYEKANCTGTGLKYLA
ncbi:MAG: hypothetical protein IPP48_03185 [Chitinophagaceae bacterium]|nr:hypothetical protein [Chitinophagaceae bacterium]